jgi:hypothetical protein
MKSAKTMANLLLGIWLLLWGLTQVLRVEIPFSGIILGTIAIVAGLLTLLGI